MKRQDEIDEIADRLQDASEDFRTMRNRLLTKLEEVKDIYSAEVMEAEEWAVKAGLIDRTEWVDEEGEPFLPWVRTEVIAEERFPISERCFESASPTCSTCKQSRRREADRTDEPRMGELEENADQELAYW